MSITKKTKVIVGMSGGVDSSVSALLLKEQGYQVEGLFMKNWEEDDDSEYCSAEIDLNDAEAVCQKIGIPLHSVNFAKEYWDTVFAHFLNEFRAGRTPNPDVLCNKEIKFKAFLDYARTHLQADYIATGHYVRKTCVDGQYQLLKGLDPKKDQSYFLYLLNQQQLAPALFPIGELEKSTVRQIAADNQLITHNKKDSTGICFIGERKFKNFLSEYLPAQPGDIKTLTGQVIGRHDGLMYYTYGQRQGLKIGGTKDTNNEPWYVIGKDLENNILVVAQGKHHPELYKKILICDQLHWVSGTAPDMPYSCQAKTRYHQDGFNIDCTISLLHEGVAEVSFVEAQRAITPGQSIVFYQGNICLGGGIIIS
jgi:tRNA-specific 2-thiouridylase